MTRPESSERTSRADDRPDLVARRSAGAFSEAEFTFTFPPLNLLIALIGTVLLALLIMRLPLRRAVRLKPGEAIRYA